MGDAIAAREMANLELGRGSLGPCRAWDPEPCLGTAEEWRNDRYVSTNPLDCGELCSADGEATAPQKFSIFIIES